MADLTIVSASVVKVDAQTDTGIAGEAITAGQPVYKDTTTGKMFMAKASGTDDAAGILLAAAAGIALNSAALNQPLTFITAGTYVVGATVVKGGIYVVSATFGGIAPYADLNTDKYVTILGWAYDTTHMTIKISASAVRHA